MSTFIPPSSEQLTQHDPWLVPYRSQILHRLQQTADLAQKTLQGDDLSEFALGYLYFGLHPTAHGWIFREWAPAATQIFIVGEFSQWTDSTDYQLTRGNDGEWTVELPDIAIKHGDKYTLHMYWDGGDDFRVPAWATYVVQDDTTKVFDAVVWQPEQAYQWNDHDFRQATHTPLIYETHVGMSSEHEEVNTYADFANTVIPRIKAAGYNTIQLMAIAEHPYYGSFGYHVSSFFAPSSRFGTPDDFRRLVDTAHQHGLAVVIDIVHSHAVKNESEGLSRYDGTYTQYFHQGERGDHAQWDSRVFDYGKPEVLHFLLSNCRYWLDEFHVDGYRFDGITSMIYTHHGLSHDFTSYDDYFRDVDDDAVGYLTLANKLIHDIKPTALTIAEDMSAYPGIAAPLGEGGVGFDYRLSMGVPDLWIKYTKDVPDEQWSMSHLYHELIQHRPEEKTISYAESHDQALVGDKTLIFRLIDSAMYDQMAVDAVDLRVDRGIALHKMIRLLTASLHHGGYLNFMGNEFGHPEWIDFPREDNGWSYHYARRQWNLVDNPMLKYHYLAEFDRSMVAIVSTLDDEPSFVTTNDDDHVVSYVRDDKVFIYNFDATRSFTGYGIQAPAGLYSVVMSSDDPRFGGFDRIDTNLQFETTGETLQLYLPARTVIVLERQHTS